MAQAPASPGQDQAVAAVTKPASKIQCSSTAPLPMSSSEVLLAAAKQIVLEPAASVLSCSPPGAITWAVLFVGEARSLVMDTVHDSIKANLLKPLEDFSHGGADVYFNIDVKFVAGNPSVRRWLAVMDGMRVLGLQPTPHKMFHWRDTRLKVCFAMMQRTEQAAGRDYDYVITSRPDLEYLQPVRVDLLTSDSIRDKRPFTFDMMAHCRRSTLTERDPCTSPNKPSALASGPGHPALWHFRMVRMNPVQTEREWWLGSVLSQLQDFAGRASRVAPKSPRRVATCALGLASHACRRYEIYAATVVRRFAPIATQWALKDERTVPLQGVRLLEAVRASAPFALFNAMTQQEEPEVGRLNELVKDLLNTYGKAVSRSTRSNEVTSVSDVSTFLIPTLKDIAGYATNHL
eukprot:CAMPEP_0179286394 /NCGR_PEP_ID=MMETSP0797-20121207/39721_1 /TAXON_ID=47934 /ORGANISM="Dinophysis acuminata, Strain DAEP01" /LENGTH=404 /DNA_ID=CAMNT_0020995281 /DNA_START=280 /DNA_END=1495 /DNA_ORIENTATION=-